MRITNVRLGHACNSSSTHTLLIGREVKGKADRGDYGWQHFILSETDDKMDYLGNALYQQLRGVIGDDMTAVVLQSLFGEVTNGENGYGIDHQSVPVLPTEWGRKGVDKKFLDAFTSFLRRPDVAILGGNDNEEWGHKNVKESEVVPYPFREGTDTLVAREDDGLWTLFSPESGTRVSMDFSARYSSSFLRKKPWEGQTIHFPWLVDMKITDYCNYGCAFCYQGSTDEGKHADLWAVRSIARTLGEGKCFEVAIGGGEPTLHPDFFHILEAFRCHGVTPNFTTRNIAFLKKHQQRLSETVGAIAVSVDNLTQAKAVRRLRDVFNRDSRDRPRLHVQVIDGMVSDPQAIREALDGCWPRVPITLLGYKTTGRGSLVTPPHLGAWKRDEDVRQPLGEQKEWWRFPYAVDTAFLSMYKDDKLLNGVVPETSDVVEGRTSCYIDAVSGFMAKSSYERIRREELDMRYLRIEDVRTAWEKVRATC